MMRLCLALATMMLCGWTASVYATPLYPDRVAPAHRMADGSTNHVFLERLPVPKPRDAVSALPPPPAPQAAAKTTILNPASLQPATAAPQAVAVNPYENAPFQVKPRSEYKKLRSKRTR